MVDKVKRWRIIEIEKARRVEPARQIEVEKSTTTTGERLYGRRPGFFTMVSRPSLGRCSAHASATYRTSGFARLPSAPDRSSFTSHYCRSGATPHPLCRNGLSTLLHHKATVATTFMQLASSLSPTGPVSSPSALDPQIEIREKFVEPPHQTPRRISVDRCFVFYNTTQDDMCFGIGGEKFGPPRRERHEIFWRLKRAAKNF
jgi:hypothetical protein